MQASRTRNDFIGLVLILLFAGFVGWRSVDFSGPPLEDAAILMRYADHLANGHGIVWNIGEAPVDGATDFLLTVTIAGIMKTGIPLETATRGVSLVSHLLTLCLVFLILRRVHHSGWFASIIPAMYLAAGPGLDYVATYFGTPYFALWALLTWMMAMLVMDRGATWGRSTWMALFALLTALTRPEGVILAWLMLAGVVVFKGFRASWKPIIVYAGVFLILGGGYFIWRWTYFGHPLPNPFYIKGGGLIHLDGLKASLTNTLKLGLPFWFFYLAGLYDLRTLRRTIAYALPIAGFTVAFVLLSNEMNFGARFQYVMLPIVLVSWHPLMDGVSGVVKLPPWTERTLLQKAATSMWVVVLLAGLPYFISEIGMFRFNKDGRYGVASALAEHSEKGYTLATSEAGLLPLYSGWRALDTLGLNDAWIAQNGMITREYLESWDPEVIVFHAFFSPLAPPDGETYGSRWIAMTYVLNDYAVEKGYILAAAYGENIYDTHYYYVKPGFTDSSAIVEQIRRQDYIWTYSGNTAVNFATLR